MRSDLLVTITLFHFCHLAHSSPLGPNPPGAEHAVPYYTTRGYIMSKLKNIYNYIFNKEDSIHEDGYTKVYVMSKHMYYTYTHEFTRGQDGADGEGNRITDDPLLKEYMKNEDIMKHKAEIENHVQKKKQNDEEVQAKQNIEKENDAQANEGLLKKTFKNIPILKRFVREAPKDSEPQSNFFKEKLKKVVLTVWGKPHSKVSDNLRREFSQKFSKVSKDVGDSLGQAKETIVEGAKTAAVALGTKVGQIIFPQVLRESALVQMGKKMLDDYIIIPFNKQCKIITPKDDFK